MTLNDLKKLAAEATPGSWPISRDHSQGSAPIMCIGPIYADSYENYSWLNVEDKDALYVSAANPETILKLIDLVDTCEGALNLLLDPKTAGSDEAWNDGRSALVRIREMKE